jgi:site-specific DNA-cytosine methylase
MLPTPNSRDWKDGWAEGATKKGRQKCLNDVVMWATPTAFDWNTSVKSRTEQGSGTYRHNLKEAVLLWPTPGTSGLSNGTRNCETINKIFEDERINDEERRSMRSGNGGQLNADWVERLMGYPDSWTDIDVETVDKTNRYPAAWLDGSWDTIPRVVTGQKNRKSRLKGIGNSIVPQCAEYLWGLIKEALWY